MLMQVIFGGQKNEIEGNGGRKKKDYSLKRF